MHYLTFKNQTADFYELKKLHIIHGPTSIIITKAYS